MLERIREGLSNPRKIPPFLRRKWSQVRFEARTAIGADTVSLSIGEYTANFVMEAHADKEFLGSFSEEAPLENLLSQLKPTDVLWDIGANVGVYSRFALEVGVTVVAFEPDDPTRSTLRRTLEHEEGDATVLSYGLGDERRTIERHLNMQRENEPTEVTVIPGDKLLSKSSIPAPTVLKIDVEGMEFATLRGLESALEDVRLLYMELHPAALADRDESTEDLKGWLENEGFALSTVPYGGGNPIVRGERLPVDREGIYR